MKIGRRYSCNKIRKTQNEHLNIYHMSKFELSVVVNLMFLVFIPHSDLESIGDSLITI